VRGGFLSLLRVYHSSKIAPLLVRLDHRCQQHRKRERETDKPRAGSVANIIAHFDEGRGFIAWLGRVRMVIPYRAKRRLLLPRPFPEVTLPKAVEVLRLEPI
jgi:hypothetical protein